MKNLKRTVYQFYLLNFFIVLILALIAKTFTDEEYFLTLFAGFIVVYMIYRMNAYYAPLYYIAKRGIALNKKVDNYLQCGISISEEEKIKLHKETESLRKEFEEVLSRKFII